jgi:hypothetical protein
VAHAMVTPSPAPEPARDAASPRENQTALVS